MTVSRAEIIYLITRCIEKYQQETGMALVPNTNKKNYEPLSILLSEISNRLPETAESLQHIPYTPDAKKLSTEYPFRKYDITGGQIRDAFMGLVANPRPFLVDACYIYLYKVGRQGFEMNPVDDQLERKIKSEDSQVGESLSVYQENEQLKNQLQELQSSPLSRNPSSIKWLKLLVGAFGLLSIILGILYYKSHLSHQRLSKQMSLLPYQPTAAEIDSLQGIWICYTGSPQVRQSDPERYHKIVANLVQITYQPEGYFLVERYGASFNHSGYAQFESPGLVSIHTHVKNNSQQIESPRHSLLSLQHSPASPYVNVMSASWNFDVGKFNQIIGIREVYEKIGKGGTLEEVYNSLENAQCKCKIVRWHQPNQPTQSWFLKNSPIDSLHNSYLSSLINENSILLKDPEGNLQPDSLTNQHP